MSQAAHVIMFWVLTSLALVVFAACVLVPLWAETQEVRQYEHDLAGRIADLQTQADRNQERIRALESDPLVNERIIRRELNYRPEGEKVVHGSTEQREALRVRVPEEWQEALPVATVPPPPWVIAVSRWLPAWPWQELFRRPANRSLMLLMAGGLLAAAFLLYGPAPARNPGQRRR